VKTAPEERLAVRLDVFLPATVGCGPRTIQVVSVGVLHTYLFIATFFVSVNSVSIIFPPVRTFFKADQGATMAIQDTDSRGISNISATVRPTARRPISFPCKVMPDVVLVAPATPASPAFAKGEVT
jgi:hypothetical protein